MMFAKHTYIRSPKHLAYVATLPCSVAGRNGHVCRGDVEAAHVRGGTDGGERIKPSDCFTLPLCHQAHINEQHVLGEKAFELRYGIRMRAIADQVWTKSPHRDTWTLERVNPRRKATLPKGGAIPSRGFDKTRSQKLRTREVVARGAAGKMA